MLSLEEGLKSIALFTGGLFVGGAIYISVVEAPSRQIIPVKPRWQQWRKSFNRAAPYVMCIGTISSAASTALYFLDTSDVKNLWLVSPCSFVFGGIFTAVVIIPEVTIMRDDAVLEKKGETWVSGAIDRWATRHMIRDIINAANYMVTIYACLKS